MIDWKHFIGLTSYLMESFSSLPHPSWVWQEVMNDALCKSISLSVLLKLKILLSAWTIWFFFFREFNYLCNMLLDPFWFKMIASLNSLKLTNYQDHIRCMKNLKLDFWKSMYGYQVRAPFVLNIALIGRQWAHNYSTEKVGCIENKFIYICRF